MKNSLSIHKKLSRPKPTIIYDTYWKFACKRQNIFFNKITEKEPPWVEDPIFNVYKFTNAYRASDRVSQYLIRNIQYNEKCINEEETLFKTILFKTFNKIETWKLLENNLNEISWKNYSFKEYEKILSSEIKKNSIYSGAYIMASGKSIFGYKYKHQNHLKLIEMMFETNIVSKIKNAESLEDVYHILLTYPTIGKFLAYQYAIDINYSNLTNFSEMDFIIPGPGAIDGIRKCFSDFGDFTESDIIKFMADNQEREFDRLNIEFKDLWGRSLQLIDCQNLFCEVDKYSRVAHPNVLGVSNRKRIKQKYRQKEGAINYFYPPKWGINKRISVV